MMNTDLIVDVPEWMLDKLDQIATLCGKSIDYVAASFFAAEVVHTRRQKCRRTERRTGEFFCTQGGTHPNTKQGAVMGKTRRMGYIPTPEERADWRKIEAEIAATMLGQEDE